MSDDDCSEDSDDEIPDQIGNQVEVDGGITTIDEILECLSDSRRRIILYYLQDNEIVELEELSKQILAREEGILPNNVPEDHYQSIQAQLVHRHLPKLATAQLIEYDQRSQTIRYRHPPRVLESALRFLAKLERKE